VTRPGEPSDRKKGKTSDYVAHQYIANSGGRANGVVAVNADGIRDGTPFPLALRVDKPKSRRTPGDVFKRTPQLAVEWIQELPALARGFRCAVVLAASL
jgi:SRSO17 transposase